MQHKMTLGVQGAEMQFTVSDLLAYLFFHMTTGEQSDFLRRFAKMKD